MMQRMAEYIQTIRHTRTVNDPTISTGMYTYVHIYINIHNIHKYMAAHRFKNIQNDSNTDCNTLVYIGIILESTWINHDEPLPNQTKTLAPPLLATPPPLMMLQGLPLGVAVEVLLPWFIVRAWKKIKMSILDWKKITIQYYTIIDYIFLYLYIAL